MSKKSEKAKRHREKAGPASVGAGFKPERVQLRTIYGGRHEAELIRDADPDGNAVEHIVHRSTTVAERMFRSGSLGSQDGIGRQLLDAAEVFRRDFERAQLSGRLAAADLMRESSGGGKGEITDFAMAARDRVKGALAALGFALGPDKGSWTGKAAWWVLGVGATLEEFATRVRWGGTPMHEQKAAGIVISAIERLAIHYGIIGVRAAEQSQLRRAEGRGMMSAAVTLRRQAATELFQVQKCREARARLVEDSAPLDAFRELARKRLGHLVAAQALKSSADELEQRGRRVAGEPMRDPEPPTAAPARPVLSPVPLAAVA